MSRVVTPEMEPMAILNLDHLLPIPGGVERLSPLQEQIVQRFGLMTGDEIADELETTRGTVVRHTNAAFDAVFGSTSERPEWLSPGSRGTTLESLFIMYAGSLQSQSPDDPRLKALRDAPIEGGELFHGNELHFERVGASAFGLRVEVCASMFGLAPVTLNKSLEAFRRRNVIINRPVGYDTRWMLSRGYLDLTHGGHEAPSYSVTMRIDGEVEQKDYWLTEEQVIAQAIADWPPARFR